MKKILKKSLFAFLLFLFVLVPCLAQESGSDIKLQREQQMDKLQKPSEASNLIFPLSNTKKNNLQTNEINLFPNLTFPMANLNQSQQKSNDVVKTMLNNQLNTVNELRELTLAYSNTIESTLKASSDSVTQWKEQSILLQKHVDTITQKLNDVVEKNKQIEAALISNNDDEHNTNLLFGEALERAELAEKQVIKLERVFNNSIIGFSISSVGIGVGTGIISVGIINGEVDKILTGAGIDLASIGFWLLGHYVFKIF